MEVRGLEPLSQIRFVRHSVFWARYGKTKNHQGCWVSNGAQLRNCPGAFQFHLTELGVFFSPCLLRSIGGP